MGEFLYGAATSAHQVEGNNVHNDWWAWEQRHPEVENSGRAADHYRLFKEDFKLAKSFKHNAHRLSLEWSRIEPESGKFDKAALAHYREVLTELKRLDMKVLVTLHHFTNPQWLAVRGGWLNGQTPERFVKYAGMVSDYLGDLVDYWITINEPMVYAAQSYWRGEWPPQKRNLWLMNRVIKQMARGHKHAYRMLKKKRPEVAVGIAKHVVSYVPEEPDELDDRLLASLENWWFNHRWFQLTGKSNDFIGVNYYFERTVKASLWPPLAKQVPWHGAKSELDWPIRPKGLTRALKEMWRYKLPLYVTENGLADQDDNQRPDFIRDHLRAVERAQAEGVKVQGYFHWSLLDNFEWAEGYKARFGLVAVDYQTMKRRPRLSARVYQAIIEQATEGS